MEPREHLWAYKGLEHDRGWIKSEPGLPGYPEYTHFDVYFCQNCLEEKLVERSVNNSPLSGSTPRGKQTRDNAEQPKESEAEQPKETPPRVASPRVEVLPTAARGSVGP